MRIRLLNAFHFVTKSSYQSISPYFILFFLSASLYLIGAIVFLEYHLTNKGQKSLAQIEYNFSEAKTQTSHLFSFIGPQHNCEHEVSKLLRKTTFFSDFIAEIGVFNQSPVLYCTSSLGSSTALVYSNLYQESLLPPHYEAFKYAQTAITQQFALIYVYTNGQHQGVSMVIPTRHIISIVAEQVKQLTVPFNILIQQDPILHEQPLYLIKTLTFSSKKSPIRVEFYITPNTYSHFVIQQSWALFCVYLVLLSGYFYYKKINIQKRSLEASILQAIHHKQFQVYYQPIMQASSHSVVGCEALLRWKHPVQGYISPAIFIPLAERLGYITPLTYFVIDSALQFIQQHKQLMKDKYISINIERSLMLNEDFMQRVLTYCQQFPFFTQGIVFELTEDGNFTAQELQIVEKNFSRLSQIGICFFIDDFGTGYSGLNFVRQFHFNTLKIDKIFIKNLGHEPYLNNLLTSMLTLSQSLNMRVIVEGVETKEQLNLLCDLGFDFIQGFYYSKPIPDKEFVVYLSQHSSPSPV